MLIRKQSYVTCREDELAIIHQIRRKNAAINSDGMSALRELTTCGTTVDPATRIERAAGNIMNEMRKLHGGKWQSQIDHQRRLVMIWAIDQ